MGRNKHVVKGQCSVETRGLKANRRWWNHPFLPLPKVESARQWYSESTQIFTVSHSGNTHFCLRCLCLVTDKHFWKITIQHCSQIIILSTYMQIPFPAAFSADAALEELSLQLFSFVQLECKIPAPFFPNLFPSFLSVMVLRAAGGRRCFSYITGWCILFHEVRGSTGTRISLKSLLIYNSISYLPSYSMYYSCVAEKERIQGRHGWHSNLTRCFLVGHSVVQKYCKSHLHACSSAASDNLQQRVKARFRDARECLLRDEGT